MSEWQPIDTCPQDGSWFLAQIPSCTIPAIMRPIGPGAKEFENFWAPADYPGDDAPVCWMPLPQLPAEGRDNG
jgi:hypothetical protein